MSVKAQLSVLQILWKSSKISIDVCVPATWQEISTVLIFFLHPIHFPFTPVTVSLEIGNELQLISHEELHKVCGLTFFEVRMLRMGNWYSYTVVVLILRSKGPKRKLIVQPCFNVST